MTNWIDGTATQVTRAQTSGAVALVGLLPTGASAAIQQGPQAFLALLPGAPYVLGTHYHRVDQFQFVTDGTATMANHPVKFGALHFSDRCQPYGPIRPDDGLSFLTLRALTGGGVYYMPEARSLLAEALASLPEQPSARRNITFDLAQAGAGVLHSDDDGLQISVVACDGHRITTAVSVGGAGVYAVIIDGTLDAADGGHGVGSLGWHEPGTQLGPFTAGSAGVRLVVLQYPVKPALADADLAPAVP